MAEINKSIVKVEDLRITKLRTYLLSIIDVLVTNKKYQINANMLSNEPNNYSLDKIPTSSKVEQWITGTKICRDVYSFRSRVGYSQDTIENLINVGFFEIFEKLISSNNEKGILPDIEGIQSIQCLNCGSMNNANTNTAEFDIQIQITYKED
nr:MAG TPA: Minor capsid protein from bacteriophage [Caudoviricetes sp.]